MDTKTPAGQALFGFLAIMAEFETDLRKERQREGILAAHAKGVHFGRAKRLSPEEVTALHQDRAAGVRVAELTTRYGLTRTSIYRYLAAQQPQADAEGYAEPGVAYGGQAEAAD
jgi:DNA invertase Pin-like site-specific DNA recombinase